MKIFLKMYIKKEQPAKDVLYKLKFVLKCFFTPLGSY